MGEAFRMGENLAERLGRFELADADGKTVRLGDFWAERPVVLAFVRHFG